jgi:hypothetical protein
MEDPDIWEASRVSTEYNLSQNAEENYLPCDLGASKVEVRFLGASP